MKKTIAAGGASLLGIGAASLGVAAPAAAAPVTDACTDWSEHTITVGTLGDNWYMDCIPQYGSAGADFRILSATGFPAAFVPLDEPAVTRIASTGAAGAAYAGSSEQGFSYLDHIDFMDTATSQLYQGTLIAPISSVASILPTSLPAECGVSFANAYVVNYAPVSVTFTQVVDGVEWRYDVETTPGPLYLGLNILNTGVLDPTANQCASSNGYTVFAADSVDEEDFPRVGFIAMDLNPYFGNSKLIPDVSRYVAPPAPSLPAMGMEVQPAVPLGIAALFLSLGVAAGVLRRRRADEVTD